MAEGIIPKRIKAFYYEGNEKRLSSKNESIRKSYDFVSYILPPMAKDGKHLYTLVLDLDETLVHFNPHEVKYYLRPHCRTFLARMATIFEIVIFTAA
jgi:TFIIF-interacting CTD phosphatase-like protein